jgi:hypothetical protein
MGPGGMFISVYCSMVCHVWAMGVDRGSWVAEVCVRFFRCSGDSA